MSTKPNLSSRFHFSYSQFLVYDASVRLPGCDWTDEHSAQGFARRESTVNFSTLLEFGLADVAVIHGAYRPTEEYERVIEGLKCPSGSRLERWLFPDRKRRKTKEGSNCHEAITVSLPPRVLLPKREEEKTKKQKTKKQKKQSTCFSSLCRSRWKGVRFWSLTRNLTHQYHWRRTLELVEAHFLKQS
jgi:hypothetical protein